MLFVVTPTPWDLNLSLFSDEALLFIPECIVLFDLRVRVRDRGRVETSEPLRRLGTCSDTGRALAETPRRGLFISRLHHTPHI